MGIGGIMLKKATLITLMLLLIFYVGAASAVTVPYDCGQFIRGKGAPVVQTVEGIPGIPGTTGILRVINSAEGEKLNKVSSSVIMFNGVNILSPKDFKKKVNELTVEVSLQESNTVSVDVRGKPGSGIRIELIQEVDADAAALIGQDGGILENDNAKIEIPQNAIITEVLLTMKVVDIPVPLPGESVPASQCIDFGPDGTVFSTPVTIKMRYRDNNNDGFIDDTNVNEEGIEIRFYNTKNENWELIEKTNQDIDLNFVEFNIQHFTDIIITAGDDHGNDPTTATPILCSSCSFFNPMEGFIHSGRIFPFQDVDFFEIPVNEAGTLNVFSNSVYDFEGFLYDSSMKPIAYNDDANSLIKGRGDFYISQQIGPGTYYVAIKAKKDSYNSYKIFFDFIPEGYTHVGFCDQFNLLAGIIVSNYFVGNDGSWISSFFVDPFYPAISAEIYNSEDISREEYFLLPFEDFADRIYRTSSQMDIQVEFHYLPILDLGVPSNLYCSYECGNEICGDGLDNNCNGEIDEGCDISECDIQSSLISYWNFDNNVYDQVGTHHGTLQGNTSYVSGISGEACYFDGYGDYISLNSNFYYELTGSPHTFSAWVYPTGFPYNSTHGVWGPIVVNSNHCLDNGMGLGPDGLGNLRAGFYAHTGCFEGQSAEFNGIQLNNWYHVVGVADENTMNLYVNGELVETIDIGYPDISSWHGVFGIGGDPRLSYYLQGYIDELRIYNRALTLEDIQCLYNFYQ